jgi:glycosyltransferase involved in cell wall biosynthesis
MAVTVVTTPSKRSPKRLLTVGHSYVVRLNRLLAEGIQDAANGEWQVTVASPTSYRSKLKPETLKIADDEKVNVVGIPVAFKSKMVLTLYGPRLRTLLNSGFDAVHCWEEPYMLSGGQVALWAPRDAVLTYKTFQNISKSYPPPFNWIERYALMRASGWVAAASLVERALENRPGYRGRPHRVIGVGVDPLLHKPDAAARARIRSLLGWADDGVPVIGYMGRLTEAKGLPLLLRILDRLQGEWRALFVGSGPLEDELRRWSVRYGSRVHVVRAVMHDEVPSYLNAMDVICVPSQTTGAWREQFGRVLIEAFACGVCVVASDSGEIPFVVDDAGRIVPEADEEGWLHAVQELLHDSEKRRELVARGHARVNAHYTWSAIGAKYVEFIDELYRTKKIPAAAGR